MSAKPNPNADYRAAREDPEHSIDRMLALVHNPDSPTGIRICALGFIAERAGREQAIEAAVFALTRDPVGLRREAIRILGKLRAIEVLPTLVKACRHVEGDTALAMIRALEQIGAEGVERGLIELLDQPEIRVSERAACALAELGTKAALDALRERAFTPPTSMALRQAVRAARNSILEREIRPKQHHGRLTITSYTARGELTEVDTAGALTFGARQRGK